MKKVDTDALLKHRFWIGLGVFGLLWLIVLLIGLITLGDKVDGPRKEVKSKKEAVTNLRDIKNENYTNLVHEKTEELEEQKKKVWAEAWKGQADLMFWPQNPRHPQTWEHLQKAGHFAEEIPPNDRSDYRESDMYAAQPQIALDGEYGIKARLWPIQAEGGDWSKLLRRATFKTENFPTNEEVWLAQEDVWVQNELVNVIAAALDSARRFEPVAIFRRIEIPRAELEGTAAAATAEGAAPAAATAPAPTTTSGADGAKKSNAIHQRFRNPHWQLDLVLEPDEKDKKLLVATTETTVSTFDGDPTQPIAGLDLLLEQRAANGPAPQHLIFEGKPDDRGRVALKKVLPLTGFSGNFDDFPLAVTLAGDKADAPPPEGMKRFRYRNPDWELELLVERKADGQYAVSGKSKVTNVNSEERTLPVSSAVFSIWQGRRGKIMEFHVPEEWLPWKNSIEIKNASDPFVYDESNPIEVYEIFSWDTCPIKRIDAIQLPGDFSFNSHRTANLVLKPATQFPPPEVPKEATAAGSSGGGFGGGPAGMGQGMGGGGGVGSGPGGGGGPDTSRTANGLVRNRYISVTEQVRHMPIALKLVVDQAHMQDVLTAVVNSKLRIQITQVQWKRAQGIKSMAAGESSGGNAAGGGSGGAAPGGRGPGLGGMGSGGGGRSSGSGPGSPSPGGGPGLGGRGSGSGPGAMGPGMGGMGPGLGGMGSGRGQGSGSGGAGSAASEDSDPNLVELAVYGIAALYERYPPRVPAKPEAGGTAAPGGQPGTPPAGGTAKGK
jgi:hypothetical protein